MNLFFLRPFCKLSLGCVASWGLFTAVASAQTPTIESQVISEPLLSVSSGNTFAVSNFDPAFGTLDEVTLTMNIRGKTVTIFSTNDPSKDWVNLDLSSPESPKISADSLAAWGNSSGNLDISYQKPADVSIESMGIAGLLLYCTPRNGAAPYIDINYMYSIQTVPEPAMKYLTALAGLGMGLMLVQRGLRRRGATKAGLAREEIPAPASV